MSASRLFSSSRKLVSAASFRPVTASHRSFTTISCGFYRTTPPASLFSTSSDQSDSSSSNTHSLFDWSVREQENLPQSELRHECGLSASNPESQISPRQPKPVKDETKMKLMHEDFDGQDNLLITLDPKGKI